MRVGTVDPARSISPLGPATSTGYTRRGMARPSWSTMLAIRPEQLRVLGAATAWPLERFAACLRHDLPEATRLLDARRLEDAIVEAVQRGLHHGLRREWDVYRFCRYRLLLGSALEHDDRYRPVREVLASTSAHDAKMDRIDYIFYRASRRCPPRDGNP